MKLGGDVDILINEREEKSKNADTYRNLTEVKVPPLK